jgi:hypothetical protein
MSVVIERIRDGRIIHRIESGPDWTLGDIFLLPPWEHFDRLRLLADSAAAAPDDRQAQAFWAEAQGTTLGTYVACSHAARMQHLLR